MTYERIWLERHSCVILYGILTERSAIYECHNNNRRILCSNETSIDIFKAFTNFEMFGRDM